MPSLFDILPVFSNGPEWWRIRSEFQKGLSSPSNVRSFLSDTDEITKEFASKLEDTQVDEDVPDFLVILSRLNLERKHDNSRRANRNDLTVNFSTLPCCLRRADEQFLQRRTRSKITIVQIN